MGILMDHSTLGWKLCENIFVLLKQVFQQCIIGGSFEMCASHWTDRKPKNNLFSGLVLNSTAIPTHNLIVIGRKVVKLCLHYSGSENTELHPCSACVVLIHQLCLFTGWTLLPSTDTLTVKLRFKSCENS